MNNRHYLPIAVFAVTLGLGLISIFSAFRFNTGKYGEIFQQVQYNVDGGGGWPPDADDCSDSGQCNPNICPAPGAGSENVVETQETTDQSFFTKIWNSFVILFTGKNAEIFTAADCTPPPAGEEPPTDPTDTVQPPINNCTVEKPCPAGCPGKWNCWNSQEEWEAAFCAAHQGKNGDCDAPGNNGKPPGWAYNDVADAVNFVGQTGHGPSDADWINRWNSGHTWGEIGGGCPTGTFPGVDGTCYIDGFQPGAVNPNCPSMVGACPIGCAMTQCPASGTDLTGLTCDCPAGDGHCGGNGGLGYFSDTDCSCGDSDPSTDCTQPPGDDDTTADDDDVTTNSYQCTGLTPQNPTPEPGSTTTFTCTGAAVNMMITHADFRVLLEGTELTEFHSSNNELDANHQATYSLRLPTDTATGTYTVQCRICHRPGSTCTAWGQAGGVSQVPPQ
ncbi:hypothetical protein A2160_05465 [Candidatus Beckwithbacteria bacterium RBG_13_42_9]|uniref:Uncharacterized protein n=1 Tax=Candidatus Beckwithbacteria bacterium RBG_13_42_9 TaxID=1797457 RepID=A0A1F5E7I6_9BACT|nr:MAG: hypothetical protein A2160_05465 [Candidatus Beckwithbacteria bacterium RBG_13_42_9]